MKSKMKTTQDVGAVLKQYREKARISLRKEASLTGTDFSLLSKFERNERPLNASVLGKLVRVLNLSGSQKNKLIKMAGISNEAIIEADLERVVLNIILDAGVKLSDIRSVSEKPMPKTCERVYTVKLKNGDSMEVYAGIAL